MGGCIYYSGGNCKQAGAVSVKKLLIAKAREDTKLLDNIEEIDG